MNRRDVWMDILPSFDRAQLGLKMALLSDRFDVLVDKHFDGKSDLTIWNTIAIRKDTEDEQIGPKAKLFAEINDKFVEFPFPDRPLPNKIRIHLIQIDYIDHTVLAFLHANKQIWDKRGTIVNLNVHSDKTAESDDHQQQIWDVLAREIWPIFSATIRHIVFKEGNHLDNLRSRTSPTILTDLIQLNSICSYGLFPDVIADDGPNANYAWQALAKLMHTPTTDDGRNRQILYKWLHTPTKNGQPKRLVCYGSLGYDPLGPLNLEWVNNFKEAFLRATTSVNYKIRFNLFLEPMPIEPFELVNERTNEKLTLMEDEDYDGEFIGDGEVIKDWLLKRCPIIAETAAVQWGNDGNLDHLCALYFNLHGNCIGPLSLPAGQSDEKVFSIPGPSDQRKKKK